jgi:hypothetical protein
MDRSPSKNDPAAVSAGSPPAKYELGFTLALAAVVAAICWQALSLPLFASDGTVGPGFFPVPLSCLLLGGLLMHAVKLWGIWRREIGVKAEPLFVGVQYIAFGLLVGAALIGSAAGLAVAITLLLVGGLIFIERCSLLESLTFSVVFLLSFYLVFDRWLGQNIGLNGLF